MNSPKSRSCCLVCLGSCDFRGSFIPPKLRQKDKKSGVNLRPICLYQLFMDSLHLLYMPTRKLTLLTICLPKLFTGAVASGGTARGNQIVSLAARHGRIVRIT
jgi:hypothetical protein